MKTGNEVEWQALCTVLVQIRTKCVLCGGGNGFVKATEDLLVSTECSSQSLSFSCY